MGIYDVSIAINYCYNYWPDRRVNEYETHAIIYLPMVWINNYDPPHISYQTPHKLWFSKYKYNDHLETREQRKLQLIILIGNT